jgi:serine protease inhibitor
MIRGAPSAQWAHVDRRFILALREHHSNSLLFTGKILDPTE